MSAAEVAPNQAVPADAESGDQAAGSTEEKSTAADGPIVCPGHTRPVPDVSFSGIVDDRIYLVSACLDQKPMLRDGVTGDWIGTFEGHKGAVWTCRLNDVADKAVTASADYTVKLWNALTGETVHTWEHAARMQCAAFSRDGQTVLSGGYDKIVRLYDLNNLTSEKQALGGLDGPIINILPLEDLNMVAAASSKDKNVIIFDLRTGQPAHKLTADADIKTVSATSDGRWIVSGAGRKVQLWNVSKLECVCDVSTSRPLECVVYDPVRQLFLTGELEDSWIRVYSRELAKEVGCYKGHHGWIRCLALSPNGSSFASGSEDATIRLWDWAKQQNADEAQ